jgi:hypothetical protein
VDKAIAWILFDVGQRSQVAGVGQLVEVDDRPGLVGQPLVDKIRADEAGTAGNDDHGEGGRRSMARRMVWTAILPATQAVVGTVTNSGCLVIEFDQFGVLGKRRETADRDMRKPRTAIEKTNRSK